MTVIFQSTKYPCRLERHSTLFIFKVGSRELHWSFAAVARYLENLGRLNDGTDPLALYFAGALERSTVLRCCSLMRIHLWKYLSGGR